MAADGFMRSALSQGVRMAVAAAGLGSLLLTPLAAEPSARTTTDLTETLASLAIDLPPGVRAMPAVREPLEQLGRESCDQDAIQHLARGLEQVGYRREAAVALVSFSSQCGGYAEGLRSAINIVLKLSDFALAEAIAADLIKLEPYGDNGYFLRALARDGKKSWKGAIDDYVTAIELFGNKDRISSVGYYNMARDYEKLGQFCDAMLSIERWVSLDPSRHDTSQTRAIVADYAAKGACAAATTGGAETFPIARPGHVVEVPVTVNGVRATFVLDTGASFVVLKDSFARKAHIDLDESTSVHLLTANGAVEGKRGRASTIQLRSLKATDVPIVVESDKAAAYHADGLLGLSFLSRFNVSIDGRSVRVATSKPR
jgi:clan AA aspartic protease (TIGR02281 family)